MWHTTISSTSPSKFRWSINPGNHPVNQSSQSMHSIVPSINPVNPSSQFDLYTSQPSSQSSRQSIHSIIKSTIKSTIQPSINHPPSNHPSTIHQPAVQSIIPSINPFNHQVNHQVNHPSSHQPSTRQPSSQPIQSTHPLNQSLYQSDRGGLRPQDNRQAGQSAGYLTVAGFGFRTIGRLVNQPTSINTSIKTSINPRDQPTSINHPQSDRGGPLGFRTIGRLVNLHLDQSPRSTTSINHFQSDRGGLRPQDNRQARQSADWSIYTSINPLDRPLQSTTSSLTVAGFGLRTIGRLVSQPTSINPRDQPTSINHPQSDRGGPLSFRTIGRLVNQYTSINPSINTSSLTVAGLLASGQSADWTIGRLVNLSTSTPHLDHHLDQPSRSTTINHFQSNRGGLRLQDNRQAGQSIHLDPLPRSPTTSLTVAGFGFRTIGRLVSQSTSINHLIHLDQPPRSTTIHHYQSDRGGLRLQDNRQAVQFKKPLQYTTSTNHINHINHALPVWPWRASASGQSADWAVNTPRSTTSINHYDQPTSINLNQPILV
ncbi:hypothetical protein EN45_077130 [Penicillium chrysogenum]|uniref:Uncharacterized protein n=1 Tax=Penicillium chrysogenum TaxID=5076 RepID=A0A167UBV8_PENCH|nr:hypothetical protein EN45_077130 [Penicillium chrysogenum]